MTFAFQFSCHGRSRAAVRLSRHPPDDSLGESEDAAF
jgi:hypothetical protein